jgi:hypothetical protein
LQGAQLSGHQIDVLPGLADLLPSGGLQVGTTYSVTGSTGLLAALLAAPSTAGLWCGLVGLPHFAAEAAHDLGCDLERLVMVPDPGPDWFNVLAALVDALPVVVTRPHGAVSPAEATRLAARLRQREGVLLVAGEWPRSELSLRVGGREWQGLGQGHGHLTAQRLRVGVEGRGAMRFGRATPHVSDVWLPDTDGVIRVEAVGRVASLDERPVEAVG